MPLLSKLLVYTKLSSRKSEEGNEQLEDEYYNISDLILVYACFAWCTRSQLIDDNSKLRCSLNTALKSCTISMIPG